jgi:hypothetical protein
MAAEKDPNGAPMWQAWADTLKAAASPMSAYASFLERWGEAVGVAPSSGTSEGAAADVSPERAAPADFLQAFLGGQQALLRMTELAAQTMRSMGTATAAGASSKTKPMPTGFDLWMASAAQYHRLAEPWTELMQRSIGVAQAMGGPSGAGDPLGNALERSFGLLVDFPGINQELPKLLVRAAENAMALSIARENYRVILAATWQRAFDEISRELVRRAADGKPVDSPGALVSLSTRVADRVFVETFNSDPYIKAQNQLSTSLADQRQDEMKLVDLFSRFGHFVTRGDHDEALREINALRREVHTLKRTMRSSRAARPEAATGTQPARNGAAGAATASGNTKRRARAKSTPKGPSSPKTSSPKTTDRESTDHGK